ncbi:MAG: SsrA-binding protein SmpB [Clostridiales bacterium]|nr:SsrA-binding protein SmpB [Clostridiales bacterium]
MKIIATNRKANFEYFIISTFEAGIVLVGSEVKSIRLGHVNLKDSFITISKDNEVFIKNMHITEYKDAHFDKVDEKRSRKLLLNKQEIKKLQQRTIEKGFTCIPLKVYLKDNLVKLEIALAKGKHLFDKKETIKNKDIERETQRQIKNYK